MISHSEILSAFIAGPTVFKRGVLFGQGLREREEGQLLPGTPC
jgi:hypothetical protein